MSRLNDWNAEIIADFRANDGRVGGPFTGVPVLLIHHLGRKTGRALVSPVVYQEEPTDPDTVYVFATYAGAPRHPDWYHNLVAAGTADVELGTETYPVTVREVTNGDRDRIYTEQARRYPTFDDYAAKTDGIRTIPVLALRRSQLT